MSANDLNTLNGLEENHQGLLKILEQAEFLIQWFSPDLDFLITDNENFYTAIFAFCKNNQNSRIQLLLHDSRSVMARGHRFINLAQRLTSKIEIRATLEEIVKQQPASFLIADNKHYYIKPLSSQWQGKYQLNNQAEANNLNKIFVDAWEQSPADSQVRRLGI